jgi:16S rRNA C1402 N4-methylase RsmH
VLTPKPLRPTSAEVAANPLARSTRLRVIERLEEP